MKHRSLYDLTKYLQAGTKLHISVLFLGNYGNEMCKLPRKHEIHSGLFCTYAKNVSSSGYKGCFWCRNLAVKKAINYKKSFGGYCINGVYEYIRPVLIGEDVACIIFIGNIFGSSNENKRILKCIENRADLSATLEKDFNYEDCVVIGDIIESHILTLLEKYSAKNDNINPLVENIKNYLLSNIEFDISISHISELFHYNKLYLGRLFKKETGMNIKDYINLQRIERAKNLLESTPDTIINISNKVGFNNVTYFNRMFKSMVGMSPTSYRTDKQKNTTVKSKPNL